MPGSHLMPQTTVGRRHPGLCEVRAAGLRLAILAPTGKRPGRLNGLLMLNAWSLAIADTVIRKAYTSTSDIFCGEATATDARTWYLVG